MNFKDYFHNQAFVDFLIEEFDQKKKQKWSAGKDEILQAWQQVRPNTPIYISPIPPKMGERSLEKSSYGEDGVRITGSWSFIASILSRLKDLLQFENPKTKLRLSFKGVDSQQGKQSFAFYINLETRKPKKPKAIKLPELGI